jgi:uncharacterized protein (TIGR03083 family)
MTTGIISSAAARENARSIPGMTHAEAGQLATTELERLLSVVESLSGDDWNQPTDCTEWTVRDMVAHLAGACAAYTSWSEFFHQMVRNPYMRSAKAPVDAINRLQIEDRAGRSPEELVAELREVGPKAARNRYRVPWLVRNLRAPFGEPLGFALIGYLLNTIYTRDQWMHRADLCRTTGQTMRLTDQHDARIVELVLRDLAQKLQRTASAPTIDLILTGGIHLDYRFGTGARADATITMDVIEFNRLASGRITPDVAAASAGINGDTAAAQWFLNNSDVPY